MVSHLPVVIIEVLSDSTRHTDLGEKRDAYLKGKMEIRHDGDFTLNSEMGLAAKERKERKNKDMWNCRVMN